MSKFTVKELQSLREKKKAERERLKIEFSQAQRSLQEINNEITSLNREITIQMQKGGEPVSEHAMLRYLERVKGVDMESVKNEIMEHVALLYPITGDVRGTIDGKKFRFVIRNGQVITVVGLSDGQ